MQLLATQNFYFKVKNLITILLIVALQFCISAAAEQGVSETNECSLKLSAAVEMFGSEARSTNKFIAKKYVGENAELALENDIRIKEALISRFRASLSNYS